MAINEKTPTLRKGITVDDFVKGSWLDGAEQGKHDCGERRVGQALAMKAARAAVQVLLDAVNKGERITKGEMMYFHTQLYPIIKDIGQNAKRRMDDGEFLPGLLDKLVG